MIDLNDIVDDVLDTMTVEEKAELIVAVLARLGINESFIKSKIDEAIEAVKCKAK